MGGCCKKEENQRLQYGTSKILHVFLHEETANPCVANTLLTPPVPLPWMNPLWNPLASIKPKSFNTSIYVICRPPPLTPSQNTDGGGVHIDPLW